MQQPSLDELWASVPAAATTFNPEQTRMVPDAVRQYLCHAIAPGTSLASAVRLHMHGEIKLNKWLPFEAEQVITAQSGMIWSATVRMVGLPVSGFDCFLDGKGAMRWKLLGLFPIMSASGPDITRSAIGRLAAESVWLPSLLCRSSVQWRTSNAHHICAAFSLHNEAVELTLSLAANGAVQDVLLPRWGNPDKGVSRYHNFGGMALDESTFGGYTIPTRLRIGWYYGTDRFETEGEFFRVTVDDAQFR